MGRGVVIRDPESGKFRSVDEDSFIRSTQVTGVISGVIPAADNSGGTTTQNVVGDASEVIDAGTFLDAGEIFTIHAAQITASLGLPTTATAEGSGAVGFVVATDNGFETLVNNSAVLGISAPDSEVGIADVTSEQAENGNIIMSANLKAEASHSDTVNALAGGGDYAEFSQFIPLAQTGSDYHLDESDEVSVPFELETEDVSDHKLVFTCNLTLYGSIRRA